MPRYHKSGRKVFHWWTSSGLFSKPIGCSITHQPIPLLLLLTSSLNHWQLFYLSLRLVHCSGGMWGLSTYWLSQGNCNNLEKPYYQTATYCQTQALGELQIWWWCWKHKPFHVHIFDISQGLSFHSLRKIVCGHYHVSPIPRSSRERPNYVQSPLSKWPKARNRV